MAVEYFDGFDEYSTSQIYRYWNGGTNSASEMCGSSFGFDANMQINASAGRNSSGSFKTNGTNRSVNKVLASQATRVAGIAVKFAGFATNQGFMAFGDAGTTQVVLCCNADGTLSVKRGATNSTVLGTSVLALSTGTWYYVEFKATINNTTGSFTVNVNGVQWLTASSQNTRQTANNSCNQVAIGCATTQIAEFDDFYCEDAGNFLGDCRVETKLPTGDGVSSQFTHSTGTTNFGVVDENPATDDTDYNSDATAGHIDLYTFPALSTTSGSVKAVMTSLVLRNDNAGLVTAESAYRIGSTNYFGADKNVGSTTYAAYQDLQVVSPATSSVWSISEINAAQFGIKHVA